MAAKAEAATELVRVRVDRGVAWVTQNRPQALNAWTATLGRRMLGVLARVDQDPAVRVVVLTGAGRGFCAGNDLKEDNPYPDVQSFLRSIYNPVILRVRELPKPVIAAVNGPAVGFGASLALACDLIVAAESAYFQLAFARIGLTLDGGSSATLAARLGHARALELALLAGRLNADRALAWGLVNAVTADDGLAAEAERLALELAAGPPRSFAATKRLVNERLYAGLAEHLEREAALQQELSGSADFAEGVDAFVTRRRPMFTGS